jgi:predicted membrane-bound spermidine synthase
MPVLIIYSAKPGLYYLPGVIIWLLTFLTGILTGLQYHLSTRISKGDPAKVAASTYGADLAGSAFGAFFIALFIFPLTGLYFTCILLAILNFATAARLKFKLG